MVARLDVPARARRELLWRSGRLVIAFALGHIGATLLVAVGLTAAVASGRLSADVTRATDVGMSYGASAVLGSLSAAIPRRWRPAWTGWWLAVAVAVAVVRRDFTDAGHAVALCSACLPRRGSVGPGTGRRCAICCWWSLRPWDI